MKSELSRRRALQLVLASASLGACSGGPASFGDISAGAADQIAVGSVRAIPGYPAILGRDANGVYAMTSTCTHQQCDLAGGIRNTGIICPCHSSEFDFNGNVVHGPAVDALQHFSVTADSLGNLTIHGGQSVDSSVRLKV